MARKTTSPRLNVLQFHLNGADYTLRGDMSVARMEQIVELVSEKVEDIKAVSPAFSPNRVAVLAALQLAAEVLELREDNEMMLDEAKSSLFSRSFMSEKTGNNK